MRESDCENAIIVVEFFNNVSDHAWGAKTMGPAGSALSDQILIHVVSVKHCNSRFHLVVAISLGCVSFT